MTALDDDAGRRHVGDLDRVVLGGLRGLGEVEADLLGVDVERRDELHVGDVVVTEHDVHQTGDVARGIGVAVVLDTLHQGRRAVADSDNCYSNRTHRFSFLIASMDVASLLDVQVPRVQGVCGCTGWSGVTIGPLRSELIRSDSQRTSRSTDSTPCRWSSEA